MGIPSLAEQAIDQLSMRLRVIATRIDNDLTISALQIVVPVNPRSGRVTGVHTAPQHKWEPAEKPAVERDSALTT